MPDEDKTGLVDLASALEALREQLEGAWTAGQGRRVRFRVSDVRMTVEVIAGREREGSGKIRWWLVEAGGAAKWSSQTTQTLELTLTPGLYDDAGQPAPLNVYGVQPEPFDAPAATPERPPVGGVQPEPRDASGERTTR